MTKNRNDFMTEEEQIRIGDYVSDLVNNKGDMGALYTEWADIEDYYENEQEEVIGAPNSKINIIAANIEGQVMMITEQDVSVMTEGETAGDDDFAEDARIGIEWTLRKNYFKRVLKSFIRRFSKFGIGCFTVLYDPDELNGFGLCKIHAMPLTNVFVDGSIKDPIRYQEAGWIAEAWKVSKNQIENWYGKDKAETVIYGHELLSNKDVFNIDNSFEDYNCTTLIKRWSRNEGKLRLEEFTGDGFLLYDSHKSGTRKSNQKDSDESIKSYYKYVKDKYPVFFTFLYEREGNLWSFGDGKLLLPLQKLLNKLYDNILICSRPDKPFIDTRSNIDVDDINENSIDPIPYDGEELQGAPPFTTMKWGNTNDNWWSLINALHVEAQRVTRFSDIMTGQVSKGTDTATEAAIQQQQGSKSTDDKKNDIQVTLQEMCEYILGIMIEKYDKGRTFRISDNKKDYRWIDFREMTKVPVKIPATKDFRDKSLKAGKKQLVPKWEILTKGDGNPVTKNIEIDIKISIGAGLPRNKAFITKFMQDLAGLVMLTKDGQQRPAIFWDEFRDFMQKYVGLPIVSSEKINIPQPIVQPGKSGGSQSPDPLANLSQGGGVQMQPLNTVKQA